MNLKPNCISRGPERTLEAEKGFWKSERDETDTTRLPAAHLPSTILQLPVPLKSVVREAIEVDAVEQVESLPPREKRLRSPLKARPSLSVTMVLATKPSRALRRPLFPILSKGSSQTAEVTNFLRLSTRERPFSKSGSKGLTFSLTVHFLTRSSRIYKL